MLKKQILMLVAILFIGVSAFSQKSELKAADKAVKKEDYAAALSALNSVESLIASADAKSQAKFYYLKGMALYANGTKPNNIDEVASTFNKLIEVEKASGTSTYSVEAGATLNTIINNTAKNAQKAYETAKTMNDDGSYVKAAKGYERVYVLSPSDTAYLHNSAILLAKGKAYEKSNEQYQQLLDMGYTGITTIYSAVSIVNDQPKYYNSKTEMDRDVKLGVSKEPKIETLKSKKNEIIKAIA
ncbi:MAG: hypothetical protein KUG51_03670, partial [Urechidicola sp.]|nr:hypothetical protein [Urechidicola sp.]